jgi:YVTN family beta-propeller protein
MSASVTHAETYSFVTKWGSLGTGDGYFEGPQGVAVDSSGNVYVVDTGNRRIEKFDSNGNYLTKWGSYGSGDGQFWSPTGIAVDSSGNVYVADINNYRIQKFDSNGSYLTQWGSQGSGNGQFSYPTGVAVDSSGNIYVVDMNTNCIQKFNSTGSFITKWGSWGTGDGALNNPCKVAVDSSGNVYVIDRGNHRIEKFDSNGNYLTKWGSQGTYEGQFWSPTGIAVDSSGNIYVVDMNTSRIQKFTNSGTFITTWGSKGSGDGNFSSPMEVAVDSSGYVYVADGGNYRIQKFAPQKIPVEIVALFAYITNNNGAGTVSVIDIATNEITATVPVGSYPLGVAVTPNRNEVYVTNDGSNTVSVIDATTNTIKATVPVGSYPYGVAVTPDGKKAYVANKKSNTVSVIDTATKTVIVTVPVDIYPQGVAVTPDGKMVYVANQGSNTVSVIDASTNTVTATVPVENYPVGVAVTPDGKMVYVVNQGDEYGSVSVIDTSSNTVIATAPVGNSPLGVVVTPDCKTAYVTIFGNSEVSVINTSTNTVTATVPVGAVPFGVSVTPDGKKVYVACESGSVSVIDTSTNTVTATVPTGVASLAFGQFIGPAQLTFPVANFTSNVTVGYAPLDVQFTDLSQNLTHLEWNFGDNSNNTSVASPEHVFASAGLFNVVLTASNGNGSDSKSMTINVTSTPVANFSVSVSTDKLIYDNEEIVHITGKAQHFDGSPVVNASTLLDINVKGYTQTYSLLTDSNGNISYDFKPGRTEAGNITAKVSVSSNSQWVSAETSFNIYGLYITPSGAVNYEMSKNSSQNITFSLCNYGDSDLHGVTVHLDGDSVAGVETQILQIPPETLAPWDQESFVVKISSTNVNISQANYTVRVTTNEGTYKEAKLLVHLADARPVAVIDSTSIVIGMNPSNSLVKTVTISNAGYESMNNVNISKPSLDWVSVSAANLGNVLPGMNKSFSIFLSPGNNTPLGVYQDTITISSSNHQPVNIYLSISVTSSEKGDLMFHVANDIGQNISGASVAIQNPVVPTEIFNGISDENGDYIFKNISSGRYNYFITTSGHEAVSGSSTVSPGIQTLAEPVLLKDMLGVKLNVMSIKINDTYDVLMNLTFETDVPPPLLIPSPMYISSGVDSYESNGNITISNPGLISVSNVVIDSSSLQGVDITFPTGHTFDVDEIKAKSSITVPYHLTVTAAASSDDGCRGSIGINGDYLTFETNSDVTHKVYLSSEIPVFIPKDGKKIADYFGSGGYHVPVASYSLIPITHAVETVHERVKFNIPQKATLERDAFAAGIELTNKLTDRNIENVHVNLVIKDKDGNDASGLFFVNLTSLSNINSIDGSGVISPSSVAAANWLLVPEINAGGTAPSGKDYTIQAFINYAVNGISFNINSTEGSITVKPQPLLDLNYTIPENVKADKPFNITLNVTNVGYGTANNLKLDSGQPIIYENKAGLLATFELISSGLVNGYENNSMLIDFGNLAPGESKKAYWIMKTSLDGNFTEFKGSFSHNNTLGGAETSLINDIKYTIVKEEDNNPPSIIPEANFTSNVTQGNAPLSVQFNDTSTGSPTSWSWDFGDGNTSTEKDPTYTFLKPGNYTVKLTASNARGADSFSHEIKVTELNFDVNPPKIRISDNVEFDAYKYTDELHGNFVWEFGDGTYNESGNSIVTHNYSKPGSYTVNLSVRDSVNIERNVSKTINVTIPVVLVHGFCSSSAIWQNMSAELHENGFEVWNFDYQSSNTADPRTISLDLAGFIEKNRYDLSYNGQRYTGEIDIVCHSMGAIVSRLYMERDDDGIHGKEVRQWIGIAPAHGGAAFADELTSVADNSPALVLAKWILAPAVDQLKTTSSSVASLSSHPQTTKYWVIAGWNPTHAVNFGNGLSATRAKDKTGLYYWTYSGDMIIATQQSYYDESMEFEAFPPVNGDLGDSPAYEFDHLHIHSSPKVIAYVIDCLKDINKHSTKTKPPEEKISLFNFVMHTINGLLGTTAQHVEIPILVPIGSNNGANLLMATSSDSVSVPDTSSSSENMLSTTLEWDEGDITMILTSPSGIEYSEDSHPNDVWYTKNGNSISYIVTAPESGNWTAKLIPAKYPGYDIQYNLTYLVRTINVTGSSVLPVANFTGNVTEGTAPLSVQFTDMSQNATGWNWDFGDNNSSTEQNPTHTYTEAGNYTVKLSVSNPSGLGNITKPGCVIVNVSNTPVDNIGAVPYAYITVSNNVSEDNGTVIIEDYGTVMVINTATNKVTVTVPVGSDPYGVAVTPDRTKVYVANQGSDTVSVIDAATNTVISTVDVGNYPKGVAVNPGGTKVYVTNYYSDTVSVIDTSTNTVTATVSVGDGPNAVAVSPDGKNVYVVNFDSNTVSVIDTSTNTVIDTVIVGPHPQGIAVSPDGKNVYVAETSNNTVSVINTSTNTITAIVSVGSMPIGVVVSPDGEYAYVANSDRSTVSVIDTSTNAVKATVSVGIFPGGVAITPDGKKVYVTNFEDVSVIDTSTNTVTTTVSVAAVSVERWINNIAISQLPESILPVANFSSNLSSGYAPLSVQFTDLSKNAVEWNWDFGDGTNSTEQNPTHTYSAAGNYTVSLTVINANGTDSKLATISVSAQSVLSVLPGYTNPPSDLDQDGLYEDVNGNGMLDFDDVVAYYDNMEWIEENVQLELFDYNNNGLIDFDDVVKLYDML